MCDEVVKRMSGEFCFNDMFVETLSDVSTIGYVISATSQPISKLDLRHRYGKIMDASLQLLRFHNNKLHQLEVLKIYVHNSAQVVVVASFLNTCINLREAVLYFLRVDPVDMKCLAGGLKTLSKFQKLNLQCFGNTSGGITQLFSGLQHLPNSKLDLTFQGLGISDVVELCREIQQLKSKNITRLHLNENNIEPEGATTLAAAIQQHKELKYLDLSCNNIGSEGATALAAAIQHLKELKFLNLSSNSIGSEGVTALTAAIQHHNKLKILGLSSNNNCF